MSSIYKECREAARKLLSGDAKPSSYGIDAPVFTELDVVIVAARQAGTWDEETFQKAQREASNAMGQFFRDAWAVRYGPVQVPGVNEPDYMRVASRILYAPLEGPATITTVNGTFASFTVDEDPITRQGRRLGANRDDTVPWDEQDILSLGNGGEETPEHKIQRLERELRIARQRIAELESVSA